MGWREEGAVVVAGKIKSNSKKKIWLRSDYQLGDILFIHPLMMHAGVPNFSNKVRISSDFRYQRKGTPTHWESHHSMEYTANYFTEVFQSLDKIKMKPGIYEKVWERMRLEGPAEVKDCNLSARIHELINEELAAAN